MLGVYIVPSFGIVDMKEYEPSSDQLVVMVALALMGLRAERLVRVW